MTLPRDPHADGRSPDGAFVPDLDDRALDDDALDDEALDDEALDGMLAAGDGALRSSLAQILAPPADLETRIGTGAAAGLMNRSLVGTAGDLLMVGWHTVRFLFTDAPHDSSEEARP